MFKLAVRGFLIGAIFWFPAALTAQEETKEHPAPLEQSKGGAKNPPTPKDETGKTPAKDNPQPTKTLPAPTVQHERPSEPACNARCQAAQQREKADLKAQQGMESAAVELIKVSWWQFFAGVVGLGALFLTLKYTRDTAKTVSDTAQHELRAYIDLCRVHLVPLSLGAVASAVITAVNAGKTPAHDIAAWYATVGLKKDEAFDWNINPEVEKTFFSQGPEGKFILNVISIRPLDNALIQSLRDGAITLYFFGNIEYRDVFKNPHSTKFRYKYARSHNGADILVKCSEGNESD